MGLIQLGLTDAIREAPRERRSITQGNFPAELLAPPVAGVSVTHESARSLSAYLCGITVISGDVGLLDRFLFKKVGDDRERAEGHPVYRLVHDAPNSYTIPMVFWQTLVGHVLGWGNAFAEVEWSVGYQPMGLHIVTPDRVQICVENVRNSRGAKITRVYYLVDGQTRVEYEDMLHLPGLGFDGIRGYSVLQHARRSLGLGIALETFGASYFGNGAWPGIALQHPGELSKPAQDRLRAQIESMHKGPDQAFKLMILEEDMKVSKPITIAPEDGQWLESRQFSIEEIARWFNLPPHKLKHRMGDRPGGNLEASQIDYLTGTLLPWTTKIEQELNRKLVVKQPQYYVEHQFQKLLRADAKTRAEVQRAYYEMKVLTPEDIARQENLPKPKTQEPPAPPSALPPPPNDSATAPPAPPSQDPPERAAQKEASLRTLTVAWVGQCVKREAARVRAAAKKPDELETWARGFYGREAVVLAQQIEPVVRFRLEQAGIHGDAPARALALATEYVEESLEELLGLRAKDLPFELDRLAKRWESVRPARLAEKIMALAGHKEESNAA